MTHEESEKLRRLYEIYEQPMFKIAFAVLHDTGLAEDAVSDAFVRIINKLHKIRETESDKTKRYIVKIIKSTAINIYRKNRRQFVREIPIDDDVIQLPDTSQDIEKAAAESDEKQKLNDMIEGLGDIDRKIIILRCREELSWREVAQIVSLTECNVRKRFERTKKRLSMKGGFLNEK